MAFVVWLDTEAGMLPAGYGQAGFMAHPLKYYTYKVYWYDTVGLPNPKLYPRVACIFG